MQNSNLIPDCRFCPSNEFELAFQTKQGAKPTRYMPICHRLHILPESFFPVGKLSESTTISRANINTVKFLPASNCPHVESLRQSGDIPWPTYSINNGITEFSYRDACIEKALS